MTQTSLQTGLDPKHVLHVKPFSYNLELCQ